MEWLSLAIVDGISYPCSFAFDCFIMNVLTCCGYSFWLFVCFVVIKNITQNAQDFICILQLRGYHLYAYIQLSLYYTIHVYYILITDTNLI